MEGLDVTQIQCLEKGGEFGYHGTAKPRKEATTTQYLQKKVKERP